MELYNLKIWKLILSFVILLVVGCSASIPDIPPTKSIGTSEPLSFTGIIAFVHVNENDGGIYVLGTDGDLENLTQNLPYSRNPAWSSDGKYIAFNSPTDGIEQIYTVKADGSDLTQLTFDKAHSYSPAWSPDGKYIVFLSERDGVLSDRGVPVPIAYITNSDGSNQRRLVNREDYVNAVSWYPKHNLVSVSVPETRYTLKTYITDLDGIIQDQYPEFVTDGIPIWSPSGELILFNATRANCSGIVVAMADGSKQTCLIIDKLYPPVSTGGASWSPDGKYIIFSSNLDGDSDLYIVNADGSSLLHLTDLPGDEGTPVWSQAP